MKVPIFAKPSVLRETGRLDHQRVTLPMADRVAVGRRVRVQAVPAPIGGDDPVRISGHVLIKEHDLGWQLNDPAWSADARNAWLAAIEHRVDLTFVVGEILHFGLELRLVGRGRSRRKWRNSRREAALIGSADNDFSVDHSL